MTAATASPEPGRSRFALPSAYTILFVLIVITAHRLIYVLWMLIYLLSLPIWNFILPTYSFWHFDDFSWGDTRQTAGAVAGADKGGHDEDGTGQDLGGIGPPGLGQALASRPHGGVAVDGLLVLAVLVGRDAQKGLDPSMREEIIEQPERQQQRLASREKVAA